MLGVGAHTAAYAAGSDSGTYEPRDLAGTSGPGLASELTASLWTTGPVSPGGDHLLARDALVCWGPTPIASPGARRR